MAAKTPTASPPEPEEPSSPETIGSLAARGVLAMGTRQVVVWLLNFAGGVALARLLVPADFGLYAIAAFVLVAFTAFGDGGLGASLIRQEEAPTLRDYRSIFFIQQMVIFLVVAICWGTASLIVEAYGLRPDYAWFIRLASLSLLIISFQTISATRLERRLQFTKIGVATAAGTLAFNITAVGLAVAGAGAYSFGAAMVADAAVATLLLLAFSPWPMGWSRPDARIRSRLRFGIPYQGIAVVSLLKDSISPVFIGVLLGATSVGYVKWAETFAAYALFALMFMQRVFMPTFARLQSDRRRLGQAVESVLKASNAVVAPIATLTLVLAEPITRLIFGEKWIPALGVFYAIWVANAFVPTAVPVFALLNALGESGLAFLFAVVWMVGTWALGVPLILATGVVGFGLANASVQLTNVFLFRAAQRRIPFRILRPVVRPWGLAIVAALPPGALQLLSPAGNIVSLVAYGCLGMTIYGGLVWRFEQDEVRRLAGLLGVRVPPSLRAVVRRLTPTSHRSPA
jgi:O-antigen/teichoic acid export membrane protein